MKNVRRVVTHKTMKNVFRIRRKHGIVVVTEDDSLIDKHREITEPCGLVLGAELLHNHLSFGEPKLTFDELNNKKHNIEPKTK